jgi:hypothetical protein
MNTFGTQLLNDVYQYPNAVPYNCDPEQPCDFNWGGGFPYGFFGGDDPSFGGGGFETKTLNRMCADAFPNDPTIRGGNASSADWGGGDYPLLVWGGSAWYLLGGGHHYFNTPFSSRTSSSWYVSSFSCLSYAAPNNTLSANTYSITAGQPVNLSYDDTANP